MEPSGPRINLGAVAATVAGHGEDIERLQRDMYGNGREGVLAKTIRQEERQEENERRLAKLERASAIRKPLDWKAWSAIVIGLVSALGWALKIIYELISKYAAK